MEYKRFDDTVFLRLDPGEDISESVLNVAKLEDIALAEINGLGTVNELEVGIYDVAERVYHKSRFEGSFEISSLYGTITTKDGEPYLHLHINCAGMGGSVIGGHLNRGIISSTAEIIIRAVDGNVGRKPGSGSGTYLFDFDA